MEAQLRPWLAPHEAARVDELLASFQDIESEQVYERVSLLMKRSEALFDYQSLNLYAGTNVMDPLAQKVLSNSLIVSPGANRQGIFYRTCALFAAASRHFTMSLHDACHQAGLRASI